MTEGGYFLSTVQSTTRLINKRFITRLRNVYTKKARTTDSKTSQSSSALFLLGWGSRLMLNKTERKENFKKKKRKL